MLSAFHLVFVLQDFGFADDMLIAELSLKEEYTLVDDEDFLADDPGKKFILRHLCLNNGIGISCTKLINMYAIMQCILSVLVHPFIAQVRYRFYISYFCTAIPQMLEIWNRFV